MANGKLLAAGVLFLAAFLIFGCTGAAVPQGTTSDGHPYRGSATPKVVIYEHSDFECPFCGAVQPTVEQVLQAYPNEVQLQFRHNPLPIHPRAVPSAIASVCAQQQGKFWEMHDKLFGNQNALEDADLQRYAQQVGLDMAKFNTCITSDAAAAAVQGDEAEGQALGIQGTPTFIIGQSKVIGNQPFSTFKAVIDSEIARAG
ncbi:Thioredoxin [uncultured archaeon]|nr:Thioredoxin [uncultured archaeon]